MKKQKSKVVIEKDTTETPDRENNWSSLIIYSMLGYLLFVAAFLIRFEAFPKGQTITQQVYSAESDHVLYAPSLLSTTPSITPAIPLPITLTGDTWTASAPSSIALPEDYCIDVPVLMYHHVQPLELAQLLGHPQLTVDSNIFNQQMQYLVASGYNIISAEDLVTGLIKKQALPKKPIVITIDDAYDDNYTYAFLTAKKYNIVMNFMIPTALIDKPGYMTWEHVKEMNNNPYAKIYNHTATHAPLGYISDEEIDSELSSSSAALKKLGLKNTIFAYPYGSFSDIAVEKVKNHGFAGAYSTIEGRQQCQSQVMTLQRMHVGNAPLSAYGL